MTKNEFIKDCGIYSLSDIKSHCSGHWFSKGAMAFFSSRLSENLYYVPKNRTILFISSERFNLDHKRLYSIRSYNVDDRTIGTVGEFQQYKTLNQAKRAAMKYAAEDK